MGGWALGMRSLMIMTQGEDYVMFAEAKGLKDRTIFTRYAMRNAMLPQITGLALALGTIVAGAVLVEVIFGFPGIGTVLYVAIRGSDYLSCAGGRVPGHRFDRAGNLHPGHHLSAARPAHQLSEGLTWTTSVEGQVLKAYGG